MVEELEQVAFKSVPPKEGRQAMATVSGGSNKCPDVSLFTVSKNYKEVRHGRGH